MNNAATAPEIEVIPAAQARKHDALAAEAQLLAAAVRLVKRHPVALLLAASLMTAAVLLKPAR